MGNQQRKHPKRLVLQPNLHSCLVQFARFEIELKYAKTNDTGGASRRLHGGWCGKLGYRRKNASSKDLLG
jgi:hypothetical protein